MKQTVVALFVVLALAFSAMSQEMLIANGSSSGTYKQFLKELSVSTIESGIAFKEVESHGSVENLDLLVNNKVMCAFMHSDVIAHRAKNEPHAQLDKKFQTLLALFPEDVHFLTLATSKRKTGGTFGYGATPIVLKTVDDLAQEGGLTVGAAGGGWITANMIKLLSDIPYRVLPTFKSGAEVLAALDAGTIDAAVFVGAAPLPNLENLDRKYKLLAITGSTADKLRIQYAPASVTYTKMSPTPVATVSAQALLVSKVYKSPAFVSTLTKFRNSFNAKLDEIKETPGNHPKWQSVEPNSVGPWAYLELNGTNAPAK